MVANYFAFKDVKHYLYSAKSIVNSSVSLHFILLSKNISIILITKIIS